MYHKAVVLQMRSLQNAMEKNCQELQDLRPLMSCLTGSKEAKEKLWTEVFRFMDQVMPTDTADCSLYLLAGDAFNAITYADQVCCCFSNASAWLQMTRQHVQHDTLFSWNHKVCLKLHQGLIRADCF